MYFATLGFSPSELLQSRMVIRIREKSHIEHQVAIRRHAVPVAEADDMDQHLRFVPLPAKLLADKLAQLVNRELGSVDDQIGHGADGGELRRAPSGCSSESTYPLPSGCGRRVSLKRRRIASSSASRKIRRVCSQGRMLAYTSGKLFKPVAFPDIHHECRRGNARIVARELRELGNQLNRQIIHRIEAEVLQGLQDRTFARPAQAGNHHQLGLVGPGARRRGLLLSAFSRTAILRPDRSVPSLRRISTEMRSVLASR